MARLNGMAYITWHNGSSSTMTNLIHNSCYKRKINNKTKKKCSKNIFYNTLYKILLELRSSLARRKKKTGYHEAINPGILLLKYIIFFHVLRLQTRSTVQLHINSRYREATSSS